MHATEFKSAQRKHSKVLTFRDSIELNQKMGVKHTPELKAATHQERVDAIFGSQEGYAQKFIDELKEAGVKPKDAWVQSFNLEDILYWIENEPKFGKQAVYLDDIDPTTTLPTPGLSPAELEELRAQDVRIIAPPMGTLKNSVSRKRDLRVSTS